TSCATVASYARAATSTSARSSSFFFSSRRRHTRLQGDWSSDVCSSDLADEPSQNGGGFRPGGRLRIPSAGPGDQGGHQVVRRSRSEERRVGKECRVRGEPARGKIDGQAPRADHREGPVGLPYLTPLAQA